jgi:hypothetical protein
MVLGYNGFNRIIPNLIDGVIGNHAWGTSGDPSQGRSAPEPTADAPVVAGAGGSHRRSNARFQPGAVGCGRVGRRWPSQRC